MHTCLIPCTQFTIHICPDLFTWTSTDHRCDWVAIANVCSDEYGGQWAGHIPMTIGNSTLLATGLVRRDTCMVSEDKGGEFRPARWATTLAARSSEYGRSEFCFSKDRLLESTLTLRWDWILLQRCTNWKWGENYEYGWKLIERSGFGVAQCSDIIRRQKPSGSSLALSDSAGHP